jgi:hypothetical protein
MHRRRVRWSQIVGIVVLGIALFLAFVIPVHSMCEGPIPVGQPYARYCGNDRTYQTFVLLVGLLVALPFLLQRRPRAASLS